VTVVDVAPAGDLSQDWEMALHLLLVRSGQRCEARTPACLGVRTATAGKGQVAGYLGYLPRHRVSIHHRRPRRMGGTDRPDTHTLPNLMVICGDGVQGCHGHLESHRAVAEARGYLLPKTGPRSVPATEPVVLISGRRVLLDDVAPMYVTVDFPTGIPDWPSATEQSLVLPTVASTGVAPRPDQEEPVT